MASANVTLAGSASRDFEADTTQRTATLQKPGGTVTNPSADTVWIDVNGGTVSTTNGGGSTPVLQNGTVRLPNQCHSFTFKTAANSSYPFYVPLN